MKTLAPTGLVGAILFGFNRRAARELLPFRIKRELASGLSCRCERKSPGGRTGAGRKRVDAL